MKLEKQDVGVWVKLSTEFPDDWEITSMRYIADHYPVENSLFEDREGALCKIGGTGRLEYNQVEWLKPFSQVYVLTSEQLEEFIFDAMCFTDASANVSLYEDIAAFIQSITK